MKFYRGEHFTFNTLKNLLSNNRYMGIWILNQKNKNKDQSKLMPYEKYVRVKIPHHEAVIDVTLWNEVQTLIRSIKRKKNNTCITKRRTYPLTGLIQYGTDDSWFRVNSSWSAQKIKYCYYYNQQNKIRISAPLVEKIAENTLLKIINNSPEFVESLKSCSDQNKVTANVYSEKIKGILLRISELEHEKKQLERRLDFLLEDGDLEFADEFKQEFKIKSSQIRAKLKELRLEKDNAIRKRHELKNATYHTKEVKELAQKALLQIREKDPKSLKAIYRKLFKSIEFTHLSAGNGFQLNFKISETLSSTTNKVGDTIRQMCGMVGGTEFESVTSTMSR